MNKDFANELFLAHAKFKGLEEDLEDYIVQEVLGIPEEDYNWPFEEITFDYYDSSFELKGCDDGLELSPEQRKKMWDIGFDRCWLCFKNETTPKTKEKYYSKSSGGVEFKTA